MQISFPLACQIFALLYASFGVFFIVFVCCCFLIDVSVEYSD